MRILQAESETTAERCPKCDSDRMRARLLAGAIVPANQRWVAGEFHCDACGYHYDFCDLNGDPEDGNRLAH